MLNANLFVASDWDLEYVLNFFCSFLSDLYICAHIVQGPDEDLMLSPNITDNIVLGSTSFVDFRQFMCRQTET